jgi:hypothetical protein
MELVTNRCGVYLELERDLLKTPELAIELRHGGADFGGERIEARSWPSRAFARSRPAEHLPNVLDDPRLRDARLTGNGRDGFALAVQSQDMLFGAIVNLS